MQVRKYKYTIHINIQTANPDFDRNTKLVNGRQVHVGHKIQKPKTSFSWWLNSCDWQLNTYMFVLLGVILDQSG